MKRIHEKFQKGKWLALIICIFFGITRFYNIEIIPVFWDEAIYLGIAEIFRNNPPEIFHTFDYYAYPVMIWMQSIVGYLYPLGNPIVVSRSFSAFSDLISAYFIFLIVRKISGIKTALIACLFYLSLPLTFFHSRFVMLESVTNMFAIIALYRAVKHISDKKSVINPGWIISQALILLVAFFTKPIAVLYFPFIFLVPFFIFPAGLNKNKRKNTSIDLILSFILCTGLIFLLAHPYRDTYTYYLTDRGNFTLNTFLHFKANIWKVLWWSDAYFTKPLIWLLGVIFIWSLLKKNLLIILLFAWCFVIIAADSFLIQYFFPRHIYPLALPVSIVVALWFGSILKKYFIPSAVFIFILVANLLTIDARILFDSEKAPIALEDKQQFFEDWTSGSGLDRAASIMKTLSGGTDMTILTDGDPLITWTLPNLYISGKNRFKDISAVINNEFEFQRVIQEECNNRKCFLVLNINPQAPGYKFLDFEYSVQKGNNRNINIYSINSEFKREI